MDFQEGSSLSHSFYLTHQTFNVCPGVAQQFRHGYQCSFLTNGRSIMGPSWVDFDKYWDPKIILSTDTLSITNAHRPTMGNQNTRSFYGQ